MEDSCLVLLLAASRAFLDAGRPGVAILQCGPVRLMLLAWPVTRVSWPCILEWQESELCRDPGGRFLYVMRDQNSVQTGVILAKRNHMETIPCHLTALAQIFKHTSRSWERLQTSVSPRRARSLPEPSATAQQGNCFEARLKQEHETQSGRLYTGDWEKGHEAGPNMGRDQPVSMACVVSCYGGEDWVMPRDPGLGLTAFGG